MSRITSTPRPPVAFFGRARGGEHAAAERTAELDRRHAYSARAALHEQRLAAREPPTVEDVAPYGEECFGKRRRFGERESSRHRQALHRRRDAELRITAAGDERAHRI